MPLTWDQSGIYWDNALIWDSSDSPGDVSPYLNKVTSEHNQKPNFMAMLATLIQPLADGIALAQQLATVYDLDDAVGVQLDAVGLWIGRGRNLTVPITGVYFTYNTGPGYNNSVYKGPNNPSTEVVALPDPQYRLYLKATVAANHWNGSVPGAYAAYDTMFAGTPFDVLIYDFQDMTMSYAFVGAVPDPLTLALFTGGYLSLVPMGVDVRDYIVPVVAGPVFAYNITNNPKTGGYNVGHYAKKIPA